MRTHWLPYERTRRTEAVIAILRRRAAVRRTRGQAVPRELRAVIDDSERHRHTPRSGVR